MKNNLSCDKCGQSLSRGSELEIDWSAIPRAMEKLKKEIGWGIPDEAHKRNHRKLTNNKKTKGDTK